MVTVTPRDRWIFKSFIRNPKSIDILKLHNDFVHDVTTTDYIAKAHLILEKYSQNHFDFSDAIHKWATQSKYVTHWYAIVSLAALLLATDQKKYSPLDSFLNKEEEESV